MKKVMFADLKKININEEWVDLGDFPKGNLIVDVSSKGDLSPLEVTSYDNILSFPVNGTESIIDANNEPTTIAEFLANVFAEDGEELDSSIAI